MVVEKLENAFHFLMVPPFRLCPPPRRLCFCTHVTCKCVDVQYANLSSVLGAPTSAVVLVSSAPALPTAPDWLRAGFHRREEVWACSGLAEHHSPFPLGCWSRAGWGAGPVSLSPLGLESSTAKLPEVENQRLAQAAGTGGKAAVQRSVPPSLYRRGVVLKVRPRTGLEAVGWVDSDQAQGACLLVSLPTSLFSLSAQVCYVCCSWHIYFSTSALYFPSSLLSDLAHWEECGPNIRQAWIQILLPPLTGSVVLANHLASLSLFFISKIPIF